MPTKPLIVAIDRVERGVAVAESDAGRRYEVKASRFPEKPAEGMVYRVPVDAKGEPQWERAQADAAEAERRHKELGDRMARLRKNDKGGDVEL
jgi:hypothetical protein